MGAIAVAVLPIASESPLESACSNMMQPIVMSQNTRFCYSILFPTFFKLDNLPTVFSTIICIRVWILRVFVFLFVAVARLFCPFHTTSSPKPSKSLSLTKINFWHFYLWQTGEKNAQTRTNFVHISFVTLKVAGVFVEYSPELSFSKNQSTFHGQIPTVVATQKAWFNTKQRTNHANAFFSIEVKRHGTFFFLHNINRRQKHDTFKILKVFWPKSCNQLKCVFISCWAWA